FLRTPATEFKHIVEMFQALSLSHPTVAFTLVHDGTEVYRLPAARGPEPLAQRVADLFGSRYDGALVPVGEATSYLSVRGVVGTPEVARRSRGDQYVFANGRYVKSRSLEHAAARAYGALLPDGSYPFLALFLDVDPRHVDVNVHPTKTEVKFDDERGVYSFVGAVVKKGLAEAGLALDLSQTAPETATPGVTLDPGTPASGDGSTALPPLPGGDALGTPRLPSSPSFSPLPASPRPASGGGALPSSATAPGALPPLPDPSGRPFREASAPSGPIPSRADRIPAERVDAAEFDDLVAAPERTVWPFRGRYLMSPVASGLLVVDQRAAHERVLYEAALAALEGGMGASQQLLFPYTLPLAPDDRALLDELLPELRALGFDLAPAAKSVEVRGVPADVSRGEVRTALGDLLDRYRKNAGVLQLTARENLARSLARRSAHREGHFLAPVEARALIDQLFACDDPFTDPAGRPTMIRIPESEIERRFG
ncbi:MAG: DNA mismatch repair protein MutL, partial [Bacteroidota bacterium]